MSVGEAEGIKIKQHEEVTSKLLNDGGVTPTGGKKAVGEAHSGVDETSGLKQEAQVRIRPNVKNYRMRCF